MATLTALRLTGTIAVLLALVLGGCQLPPSLRQGEESTSTVSLGRRTAVLDQLDQAVRQNFGHWEGIPQFNYAREFPIFREKALRENDRTAFDFLLMGWMAGLGNGHTRFRDRWLEERWGAPLPFDFYDIQGKWVVTASSLPGLMPGATLRTIDGRPVEEWFQQQKQFIDASSERERRAFFALRAVLFPLRFTVGVDGGQEFLVDRTKQKAVKPAVSHRWLQSHAVAYVRIPTFDGEEFDSGVVKLIEQYRAADAIILDVRKNTGGFPPVKLTGAFFHDAWPWWRVKTGRGGDQSTQVTEKDRLGSGELAYSGRVIVLADRRCASSCEDLVMVLRVTKRATVVGETTLGSSDVPIFLDFGNGMSAHIGFERYRLPDGTAFEGVGITPNLEVPWRVEDLRTGKDAALEKAMELARSASR